MIQRLTIRVDEEWADHILRLALTREDDETFTVESVEVVGVES